MPPMGGPRGVHAELVKIKVFLNNHGLVVIHLREG